METIGKPYENHCENHSMVSNRKPMAKLMKSIKGNHKESIGQPLGKREINGHNGKQVPTELMENAWTPMEGHREAICKPMQTIGEEMQAHKESIGKPRKTKGTA